MKLKMKMPLLTLIAALALAGVAVADHAPGHKVLVLKNKDGVAILGYDPVAYFTENKPVKGNPKFQSEYEGANYEPAFGGFCAYDVSRNKLVGVDVEAFHIVNGRLLLQYSKGVRNDFNKDPQGNLARADQNWPALVGKHGK
jgi:ABC-type amino acid transport substrate-binding protein